jgi:hypothetical protein
VTSKESDDEYLPEVVRAEDILLGSLGYGEDAKILSIESTSYGFKGIGQWTDGEKFPFESDESMSDLEKWALSVLLTSKSQ